MTTPFQVKDAAGLLPVVVDGGTFRENDAAGNIPLAALTGDVGSAGDPLASNQTATGITWYMHDYFTTGSAYTHNTLRKCDNVGYTKCPQLSGQVPVLSLTAPVSRGMYIENPTLTTIPEWVSGTSYVAGNIRRDSRGGLYGRYWTCLINNSDTGASFAAARIANPTHWGPLLTDPVAAAPADFELYSALPNGAVQAFTPVKGMFALMRLSYTLMPGRVFFGFGGNDGTVYKSTDEGADRAVFYFVPYPEFAYPVPNIMVGAAQTSLTWSLPRLPVSMNPGDEYIFEMMVRVLDLTGSNVKVGFYIRSPVLFHASTDGAWEPIAQRTYALKSLATSKFSWAFTDYDNGNVGHQSSYRMKEIGFGYDPSGILLGTPDPLAKKYIGVGAGTTSDATHQDSVGRIDAPIVYHPATDMDIMLLSDSPGDGVALGCYHLMTRVGNAEFFTEQYPDGGTTPFFPSSGTQIYQNASMSLYGNTVVAVANYAAAAADLGTTFEVRCRVGTIASNGTITWTDPVTIVAPQSGEGVGIGPSALIRDSVGNWVLAWYTSVLGLSKCPAGSDPAVANNWAVVAQTNAIGGADEPSIQEKDGTYYILARAGSLRPEDYYLYSILTKSTDLSTWVGPYSGCAGADGLSGLQGGTTHQFTTAFGTDTFTAAAHGLYTGQVITFTNQGGNLPAPLVAGTRYYVVWISANTYKVAETHAAAIAASPTVVNLSNDGTGTHTATIPGFPHIPGMNHPPQLMYDADTDKWYFFYIPWDGYGGEGRRAILVMVADDIDDPTTFRRHRSSPIYGGASGTMASYPCFIRGKGADLRFTIPHRVIIMVFGIDPLFFANAAI